MFEGISMVFVLAARIKPSTFDEFIIRSRGVGTMAFGSFPFFFFRSSPRVKFSNEVAVRGRGYADEIS